MKLVASRNCAFGSGTRTTGFEFGEFEINEGSTKYDFDKELIRPVSLDNLKHGTIETAEGVSDREFSMAYRNGHMTIHVEPEVAENEVGSYLGIKIEDTELAPPIKQALAEANIATLGDLADYGETNEGWTSIAGIGDSSDAAIAQEFAKHISE